MVPLEDLSYNLFIHLFILFYFFYIELFSDLFTSREPTDIKMSAKYQTIKLALVSVIQQK